MPSFGLGLVALGAVFFILVLMGTFFQEPA
jgi:hypothetical protein